MTFSWRRHRPSRRARKNELSMGFSGTELTIPKHFLCPISLDLMKDPVTLSTGISYDRENIEKWIESGNQTCPVTNQILRSYEPIPNHAIRKMIQDWCVANKSYGIERIPTPRIPVTGSEVFDMCARFSAASESRDGTKCQELLRKFKALARESERDKRCIIQSGAGSVLATSLESFASDSIEKHEILLRDLLSGLVWMFSSSEESQSRLGSTSSLRCMAFFMKGEDLSAKQNAVIVLKELLLSKQSYSAKLLGLEGIEESLVKIIKEPICPAATKAALIVISSLMTSSTAPSNYREENSVRSKFANMGLVSLLLEILVDGERNISEKALAVLDLTCDCIEGRKMAYNDALTMPILVKKVLRVSEMATENSVSILWKLCKGEEGENSVIEALQFGAFEKVLLVLQVGCGGRTKEKVTELLKLMNLYKSRVDCFDSSSGFRYVKRSY